jgi:hypothetical protein
VAVEPELDVDDGGVTATQVTFSYVGCDGSE